MSYFTRLALKMDKKIFNKKEAKYRQYFASVDLTYVSLIHFFQIFIYKDFNNKNTNSQVDSKNR